MKVALFGSYFKQKMAAIEAMERKNKAAKKDLYAIVEFPNAYLVISRQQLEQLK